MAKLVCIAGMNKGDQFPLHEGKNVLGRGEDCHIVLFDKKCSRRHCVVHKCDNHYSVEDLESSNGTRLRGKLVGRRKATPCSTGDIIQLGSTALKLSERAMGGRVDQEATDVAAELQGRKYDTLLKNASRDLVKNQPSRKNPITRFFRALYQGGKDDT